MKYQICVEETLLEIVEQDADSLEDAIAKVKDRYFDDEIVLDYGNLYTTEFYQLIKGKINDTRN